MSETAQRIRNIFIGTPSTRGLVSSIYALTIGQIGFELGRRSIPFTHLIMDGHDVGTQRDKIAAQFLATDASHLLLIDDDIGVDAHVIPELLNAAKPLIGVACPWREFTVDRAEALVRSGVAFADAVALSHKFNIQSPKGILAQDGQLICVSYVGCGVMLIERKCFESIADKLPLRKYSNRPGSPAILGFFDRCNDENGELLPEDFSFCKRWADTGGKIWTYPFADVRHVGPYIHAGNLAKHMKADATRLDLQEST